MSSVGKSGITPFLWLDGDVEAAAGFYVQVLKNARVESVHRPVPGKPAQSATVTLRGQRLHLFNGGPHFKLTPAFSLMVDCETQAEVDELWHELSAGGAKSRCGWLQDRYGVSWQIVPTVLVPLLRDKDPKKAQAVMQAMLQMDKLDIARLQQARDQA